MGSRNSTLLPQGKAWASAHGNRKAIDVYKRQPVYRAERYTAEAISAKIDEFHQNGYIVNYNHPTWSCEGADEFLHYGLFDGMEIFNYSAEVANNKDVYKRQVSGGDISSGLFGTGG